MSTWQSMPICSQHHDATGLCILWLAVLQLKSCQESCVRVFLP